MKTKLGVILMAAVMAVGMLATISAEEPVAGWNLARWGMTTAEIQAVYPNIKKVKAVTWDFDGRKHHGDVALAESIRVGGYDFEVRFWMDDSGRLAAVVLNKSFKQREFVDGDFAFDTVKKLLIQKYGKPTVETQKSDKVIRGQDDVYRKSVWQSAKVQITLGCFSLPLISESGVAVTYAMPGDTDKL